jgi:hypothetical protein
VSGLADLLAEPVLVLRYGHGRMMESAYDLTSQDGRTLAVGREPSLGVLGQVYRLTSKTHRDFRRTVEFCAPDGTRLFTVDKERYVYNRRTWVLDGQGNRVGRIDDASPVLSTRYRLLGADRQALGQIEGSRRWLLTVADATGVEVGEVQWDRRRWTLREGRPVLKSLKLLMIAGLVLADLTRGG